MSRIRFKADPESPAGYYHCSSRIAFKSFIFGTEEKQEMVRIVRMYEEFCQVRVLTLCCMSNHIHALIMVPRRPEPGHLPSDRKLVSLVRMVSGELKAGTLRQRLTALRDEAFAYSQKGQNPDPRAEARVNQEIEAERELVLRRMWDVSWFMRLLKQRFSIWYNKKKGNKGTIWEERFHSVLVEGSGRALAAMGAYVDLNPVRAGIIKDPARYLWNGYGSAIRGNPRAVEGIEVLASALENVFAGSSKVCGRKALELYGAYMDGLERERIGAVTGGGGKRGRPGSGNRRGGNAASGNVKMSMAEALLYKSRYFTDGVAFGSREFVESVFRRYRHCFGPKRKTGARALKGIDAEGLCTMRAFRDCVIK